MYHTIKEINRKHRDESDYAKQPTILCLYPATSQASASIAGFTRFDRFSTRRMDLNLLHHPLQFLLQKSAKQNRYTSAAEK